MKRTTEFLIIGGGIAAASTAYWLSRNAQVLLLEQESQPGYHSTGRSAALFMESYGTSQVRALTMASRAFLQAPPAGFSDHPLLTPRGAMMVAEHGQDEMLSAHWDVLRQVTQKGRLLNTQEACEFQAWSWFECGQSPWRCLIPPVAHRAARQGLRWLEILAVCLHRV